jgi:antitoxin component of RelBE/YafQ-DinJ toxin-antitoxin module
MSAINVTVKVDEDVKREFDVFCNNVGMNIVIDTNVNSCLQCTTYL